MSVDRYAWSCPITKITKCNVSPRLIESQVTVSTRRSLTIKLTESPKRLSSKSKNSANLESKRDQATSWNLAIPKQRVSRKDLKNNIDKNFGTTQKRIEINNLKSRKFRSPSKTSKCRTCKLSTCANRSIQTERQGVLSHFNSMVDGIGTAFVDNAAPLIPCVGATLAIVLFGYFSKKMEKAFSLYNTANELLSMFNLNDIPLVCKRSRDEESPIPEPNPPTNGATVDPHTLRFHYNKLKWPRTMRPEF